MRNVVEAPSRPAREAGIDGTTYASLKASLRLRGLFDRQPRYYISQVLLVLGLYAFGVAVLVSPIPFALKLLDAALFAFVYTQIGFLIHDGGHRQIFVQPRLNDIVILSFGFLLGMSRSWWVDNHNMHHSFPNDLEYDPHTAIPGLAFSQEQALAKQGIPRFLSKFQAYYFYPMLFLEGIGARLASAQFLAKGRARYPLPETFALAGHIIIYAALLFSVLSVPQALLFITVHQGLAGLYMGSVFAPNHKGMPIIPRDSDVDFLHRQVLTTRNVRPNPITDFWCGGLNYQIEHHLFPTLPRNKLKEARLVVKAFCHENSIPYLETGFIESYRQVSRHLYDVAGPLRA